MERKVIQFDEQSYNRDLSHMEAANAAMNEILKEYNSLGVGDVTPEIFDLIKSKNWHELTLVQRNVINKRLKESSFPLSGAIIESFMSGAQNDFQKLYTKWNATVSNHTNCLYHLELINGVVKIKDDSITALKEKYTITIKTTSGKTLYDTHVKAAESLEALFAGLGLDPFWLAQGVSILFEVKDKKVLPKLVKYEAA